MRIVGTLAAVAAMAATPLLAQDSTPPTRYFSRVHLSGMSINPTVRQAVTHPDWSCVSGSYDGFNPAYYAYFNEDVVEAGMDLMYHYRSYGKGEGRRPCDPNGRRTFEPDDTFTRLLPRSGTRDIVATASHDYYELPYGAGDVRVNIDGFDVVQDRLALTFIVAQYGQPTLVDLGDSKGTELSWPTGTVIKLIGVKTDAVRTMLASYGQ